VQENLEETASPSQIKLGLGDTIKVVLYILGALLLFLFALDLMVSSLQHLGRSIVQTIIQATSNPFAGLFIGLLITAMIQSSSTTTALVVAMVASGSLTIQSAVPVIMGANVGTTITSTIVSLGFINKKKEFKRAVAGGTYHCFFNLLTVIILFPLEYYYGFLSSLSQFIANYFFTPAIVSSPRETLNSWSAFNPIIDFLVNNISYGFILILLSFALLFSSILVFRKIISDLLKVKSPQLFSRFFFKNQLKSFGWGLLTTAAIRSSTITTSVVVPIVAKKIVTLRQAAPFIMGANVGTTITAFIAAALNSNTASAISIAIAHLLFNLIGVLLFFPIPVLQKLPIKLASALGQLTLRYRLAGFVFILLTFFFIPFSLIYLNQDSPQSLELTYKKTDKEAAIFYRLITQTNKRSQTGQWTLYTGRETQLNEEPSLIYPVYIKNNSLIVGKGVYPFSKPPKCWEGEDEQGKYSACTEQILPHMNTSFGLSFDSVYVYSLQHGNGSADSLRLKIYISAPLKIIVKRQVYNTSNAIVQEEEIMTLKKR
jgi:sodium-dependent phosphate cotransporter